MKKILRSATLFLLVAIFSLSCADRSGKIKPEDLGLSSDSLQVAGEMLQKYVEDGKLAGISAMVIKNNQIAYRSLHGYADKENGQKMEEGQIFRIFSMSKPVTAVALMMLYEEGKFSLDDPVEKYIPEFSNTEVYLTDTEPPVLIPQNEKLTIRHLLTHTSGMTYGWDPYSYVDSLYNALQPPIWETSTLEEFSARVAALPLKYQPGSRWEYSVSIDIAGYLTEVLSGVSFSDFLETRIFDPLKMDDTGFSVPDSAHPRLSMIYLMDYQSNSLFPDSQWVEGVKKPVTLFSGGGGLVSTIEDYSRFGRMLVNGGELEGVRILKQETIDIIMSDQLPEGVIFGEGSGYGLGGYVDIESGIYAWSGMASTFFWADPDDQMVILCFAQFIPIEKYRFANEFKEKVVGALLSEE